MEDKVTVSFFGEFGFEMLFVAPFAYWLHQQGRLEKTIGPPDTAPFYPFSPDHQELPRNRRDHGWGRELAQMNPTYTNIHRKDFDFSMWSLPPYAEYYAGNIAPLYDKPILVVSNSYSREWHDRKAHNFLDLTTLTDINDLLGDTYQIIYNRPIGRDVPEDDEVQWELGDHQHVRTLGWVTFQELRDRLQKSWNTVQLMAMADAAGYISVQGGSSIISSLWGRTNIIFARVGGELAIGTHKHCTYDEWYHKLSGAKILHTPGYGELLSMAKEEFLATD